MISATMSLYSISAKVYDGVRACVSVCVRGPGDEYCALLAAAGDQCIGSDHAERADGSV